MRDIFTFSEMGHEIDPNLFSGAALVFGHFNVIHPGHIRYFQTAKDHGRTLIVAIEGDGQLSGLERQKVFSEKDRAQAIASLEMIDAVIILDNGLLEDLVKKISPVNLVLGREFENERRAKVQEAIKLVEELNGKVIFDSGEAHYVGTNFSEQTQNEIEQERWHQFSQAVENQGIQVSGLLEKISTKQNSKLLVIGDVIIDCYVACDAVGMSSEAPVVVVKESQAKNYIGGAGVVAAHCVALGGEASFISVVGDDTQAEMVREMVCDHEINARLIVDESRPTTFKTRYMVDNQKLFRVSRLKDHFLPVAIENKVIAEIEKVSNDVSGILVCDFVYGLVTPRILEFLENIAKERGISLFGDLQCSSQIGSIAKFRDYDLLCPTEREARIGIGNHNDSIEYVSNALLNQSRAKNLIMKLGADGFIAYGKDDDEFVHRQYFPALTPNPVDVAGAGDSVLATMALGMTRGLSLMESAALACCVASLAVQTVGNLPIKISRVNELINSRVLRAK